MLGRRINLKKIPGWTVVLGIILTCGVLSMAYGYYENIVGVLYVGFAITMIGVLYGFIFSAIVPGEMRLPRHRH